MFLLSGVAENKACAVAVTAVELRCDRLRGEAGLQVIEDEAASIEFCCDREAFDSLLDLESSLNHPPAESRICRGEQDKI